MATDQVTWNVAVNANFGYNVRDVDSAWRTERIHPQDVARIESGIAAALAGDAESWSAEYRFRCAGGESASGLAGAFMARDEAGAPLRMIGSMQDVTASRRAEEERLVLRAQQAELAERAAAAAALQAGEEKLRLALKA